MKAKRSSRELFSVEGFEQQHARSVTANQPVYRGDTRPVAFRAR